MAKYKNRIVGSGEEALDQIMFNPRNWRTHPKHQQDALKGVLEEIGWVQQVIINKQTGNLIDGHLRCQLSAREGEETIPVLYIDVTEDDAREVGFDEGDKPQDWTESLKKRGIVTAGNLLRKRAVKALKAYEKKGKIIYNAGSAKK